MKHLTDPVFTTRAFDIDPSSSYKIEVLMSHRLTRSGKRFNLEKIYRDYFKNKDNVLFIFSVK